MKFFTQALLVAAMSASIAEAKKGKMFEANAFVTPKRDMTANQTDEPYLKQNYLNLRQQGDDGFFEQEEENLAHLDIYRVKIEGGVEDPDSHIVTTSDIDNYFNLQITTQLFFGSNQEPHDLILDTGSMVSITTLFDKAQRF